MKKMSTIWIAGISILTLFSCTKEQPESPKTEPNDINLTVTAEYPTEITDANGLTLPKWNTEAESIQFFEGKDGGISVKKLDSHSVAEDGANATFKTTLEYNSGNSFNYWAVSPAASYSEEGNTNPEALKLILPSIQTPVENGIDHKADLIVSKQINQSSQPEELQMTFTRPIAVVGLALEGIEDGEKINEINFSTKSASVSGTMTYNIKTGEIVSFEGSKDIIVKDIDITASKTGTTVYFTAFPAEIDGFKVTVKTNHSTYTKDETATEEKEFLKSNTLTVINVKDLERTSLHKVNFPKWDESQEQPHEGGQIAIDYTVDNPVEGGTINATSADTGFIKNLKAESGKITFDLAANETDKVKDFIIKVEYTQNGKVLYSTEVKVKQAAMPDPPVLNITWDTNTELNAEGGTFSAPYTINNPVEGAELKLSSMYGYLTNLKAENGNITFSIDANHGQDVRTDYLFCEYKKGDKVLVSQNIKIKQAAKKSSELSFSLQLDKIEADGVYIYLTPSDLNATYVVETVEKSVFDSMTEDEYIQSKITEWKDDFFDDITYHLKSGEQMYQKILCDKPGTAYYVVVYGLNEDGSRTTSAITKAEFTSAKPVLPSKIVIDTATWDNEMSPRPEDNTHYDVTVNIENPVEGTELKATTDVEWIKNLTVTKVTEEKYTVSFDTGKCKHYGTPYEIRLTYGKAKAKTIEMY